MSRELVILDLDGVVVKGQSQQTLLKYLKKEKIINFPSFVKIYVWFILYKLGFAKDPKEIMVYAFRFLKDRTIEEVEAIMDDFFIKSLKKTIFSGAVQMINDHLQSGREIIVVSNAAEFIVKKICSFLEVGNFLGTQIELNGNRYTGRMAAGANYGEGKMKRLLDFIEHGNFDMSKSLAYSDHISDLPMLNLAAQPVAVNPDKALKRLAKTKHWPILIFKDQLK